MPRGMDHKGFDPYKIFEVTHRPCTYLSIKVLQGRNITKGWARDLVDTPDPYLTLFIKTAPNGWHQTTTRDNDVNPIWNETFTFLLDSNVHNELEISLMDANYTMDEHLCTRHLPLDPLPFDNKQKVTIKFNETSEVDIEMWAELEGDTQLRYSLALCDEEKRFIDTRKQKIFRAMKDILKVNAPRNMREVPVIGVMGSGGGFRALTGFSGVMSALVETRILDMVTYVAGLSGSAWYLSQLYSHPDWPKKTPKDLQEELKKNIDSSPFRLLGPQSMYRYIRRILEKRRRGQPVSFTDFFGHLVGETLLRGRLDAKLSDQQVKIQDGNIPMPLYTCLHVKKHVSAMIFHEWVEFSPFEIGMPKYGTFMKPQLFGSKFFMGQIAKSYQEHPLHFLQGIWGSAFCIQFKSLLQNDKHLDAVELMRREREELEKELLKEIDNQDDEDSESSEEESEAEMEIVKPLKTRTRSIRRKPSKTEHHKKQTFWNGMLTRLFDSSFMQTIEGRAAMVHNFMRGLSLVDMYPFSPFSQAEEEPMKSPKETFQHIFEMHPTHLKRMYVVDGGLTFNSPYPLLLRPQRHVDLILSFDFSARPSDSTPPFKELLLAEKWARLNHVPFPPIDPTIVDREGLKECYVFKDSRDPHCPIVMHFVLINITFRDQKKPGVPRTTAEEKKFADFDLFDDPERPYSTFNFRYTHKAFDRLAQLTEFNTQLFKEQVLLQVRNCIRARRRHSIRRPCKLKDIKRLSLKDKKTEKELEAYIRSLDEEVQPLEEKGATDDEVTKL
ncbi:cytosolic phospholipase A2-like [Pomacea canaliculata]|uniref:cytosolic phospholipase A2-like n=1 Tax=Pomacea canaliculata TaxID=400727 RepID=UPI000D737E3E|nr:cytosolic phospholipase A2-like [Pomacea canaliculata]XP_025112807.1 cytosolic phospholipase A2-like [Pomacea canaliculata]XP_025112808.1 cytosolic phospholipase A2-like [Pomacea canaliculata]XP_025112809.1 cytosolic phospholipase A2-like [Pomacea canaliculata]XP_025112810.1 cytosolic phospholipase A2-like [Pomacea canaliculata]XP_025112811.1 cytosolic phospholipase A2-like [Pomacea canaliculata]